MMYDIRVALGASNFCPAEPSGRIDEVNRNAACVDQIALSSTAVWIHALPDTIRFRI